MPQGVPAIGAGQGDRAEHLQEEDDVDWVHVVAEYLVALCCPVHLVSQRAGPLRERGQLRCWRGGPGEALGKGLAPAVKDPGEAVGVDELGIPVVSESGLEIGGIADQAVAGQFA